VSTPDHLLEMTMVEPSCSILGLSEPSSIPTFAVLEVVFHPKPPILPTIVDCFHPNGTLLTWQCAMKGFEISRGKPTSTP